MEKVFSSSDSTYLALIVVFYYSYTGTNECFNGGTDECFNGGSNSVTYSRSNLATSN
jgi:hypothetical protein